MGDFSNIERAELEVDLGFSEIGGTGAVEIGELLFRHGGWVCFLVL